MNLAPIGTPEGEDLNNTLKLYRPKLVEMFRMRKILPIPYDEIGKGGFEDVIEALRYQKNGAGGSNKVIVQIQPVEQEADFLV